jgi:hypothetical protein
MKRTVFYGALIACFCGISGALAQDLPILTGSVVDGLTGLPVPGTRLRIGDQFAWTDPEGRYALAIPTEDFVLEVTALLPDGRIESLRQSDLNVFELSLERTIVLTTTAFLDIAPLLEHPMGAPSRIQRSPPPAGPPVDLIELWWSRRPEPDRPSLLELYRLELPDLLPDEIRVGRCYPDCCRGGPAPRIDSVDLDSYAAGVVTAEIGVFRALTTGEDSQLEGFKTFAIAARAYALWFYANDPDAAYHLDDTACNQRYTDGPYPEIIIRAAQETSGMYLVQEGTAATIDKFEYAASCGRHGSRPEYTSDIVPDDTDENACTSGGWCGHNDCAAHEVNPNFPDEGRCLVRGVCQWGTAERSARGDHYLDILGHYQPYLDVQSSGLNRPARLLGFVRRDSLETGDNIAGALVALDTGEELVTAEDGLFTFQDVDPGERTITVEAEGFDRFEAIVLVEPAIDNWNSVLLTPITEPARDTEVTADREADAGGDETMSPESGDTPDVGGPEQTGEQAGTNNTTLARFATVGPDGLESGSCAAIRARPPRGSQFAVMICFLVIVWTRPKGGTEA